MYTRSDTCLVWQVDASPVTVLLERVVADELRARLTGRADGDGEFGGVLLGRSEFQDPGYVTHVLGFEPLESDESGPYFTFTPRERQRLQAILRRPRRDGLLPVGLCRSHLRRGLYLDQRDFEVFQAFFSRPDAVFLLLRMQETGAPSGGFFVWDGDDMRRHQTYFEFTLDGRDGAAVSPPPSPAGTPTTYRNGATLPPAPPKANGARQGGRPAPRNAKAAAYAAASQQEPAAPVRQAGFRPRIWTVAAIAAILILPVVSFIAGRRISNAPEEGTPASTSPARSEPAAAVPFDLQARQSGDDLELTWNPHDSAIASAGHAHLRITDAGRQYEISLDRPALDAGRYLYRPEGQEVTAKLEVYSFVKGHETAATLSRPAAEERSTATNAPPPEAAPPSSRSKKSTRQAHRSEPDPPVRARLEAPKAAAPASPKFLMPDPPPVASGGVPQLPGYLNSRPQGPPAVALVSLEAAPASGVRQVLRRIPGLRALRGGQNRSAEADRFAAPKPVRRAMPTVPDGLADGQDSTVEVLARVDKNGRVSQASPHGGDPTLGRIASDAVRLWVFEPGRLDGAPVGSEVRLRFAFRASH